MKLASLVRAAWRADSLNVAIVMAASALSGRRRRVSLEPRSAFAPTVRSGAGGLSGPLAVLGQNGTTPKCTGVQQRRSGNTL
eukprot:scaffold8531_cov62-Phaeocystis_antarctica.AAC.6